MYQIEKHSLKGFAGCTKLRAGGGRERLNGNSAEIDKKMEMKNNNFH